MTIVSKKRVKPYTDCCSLVKMNNSMNLSQIVVEGFAICEVRDLIYLCKSFFAKNEKNSYVNF